MPVPDDAGGSGEAGGGGLRVEGRGLVAWPPF
jgi:hypothetical protein